MILIFITILLFSCGESKEEIAAKEKNKQDSINAVIQAEKEKAAEKARLQAEKAHAAKEAAKRDISINGMKIISVNNIIVQEKKPKGSKWDVFNSKPDIYYKCFVNNDLIYTSKVTKAVYLDSIY